MYTCMASMHAMLSVPEDWNSASAIKSYLSDITHDLHVHDQRTRLLEHNNTTISKQLKKRKPSNAAGAYRD